MNDLSSPRGRAARTSRSRKRSGFKPLLVLAIIVCAGIWVVQNVRLESPSREVQSDLGAEKKQTIQVQESAVGQAWQSTVARKLSDVEILQSLVLVNQGHPAPAPIDDAVPVSAFKQIALSRSNIEMQEITLKAAREMFAAAKAEGITDLVVTSGYRSFDRQEEIYNEARDKSYVQRPGDSEHQTGLAIDIQLLSGGMEKLGKTRQGAWLRDNAWQFGFILRYPEGKEDITGISYESWHFRYVGQPHAAFMVKKNFCLEEYIEWLKNGGSYELTVDNVDYRVYRSDADGDIIDVPADDRYSVSTDNDGGYIVTVVES